MFTRLIDPATGEEVLVTANGVEAHLALGFTEVKTGKAPKQKTEPKTATEKTPEENGSGGGEPPPPEAPEKPLAEMGLAELLAYGVTIGMSEEQLEPLSKPGSSKAKAIDAINAHVAAASAA